MHSIIQINVSGAGLVRSDEFPRARAVPRVAGRVIELRVGLRFDDPTLASMPSENAADQFTGAGEWIPFKEIRTDFLAVHRPVGWSRNSAGTPNFSEITAAKAFTPKVSVA